MPELPEVEVVRRGLADHVVGRTISRASITGARVARRHVPGPADLAERVRGNLVQSAQRRGKYLWLVLAPTSHPQDRQALVVHLGMSGQLLVEPADAPAEPHLHASFDFTDGAAQLRFVDQRTFGGIALTDLVPDERGDAQTGQPHGIPLPVRHIAADPLEPAFDLEAVVATARRRRTAVKRALLDQSLVSGIGNIYADEALWRARVHGERMSDTLTRPALRRVLGAAAEVMREALGQGGTSFDALYVNVNGASGYFDRSLHAYGQAGRPCNRCGTPIRREAFMDRSSFSCPRCQPRPRRRAATTAGRLAGRPVGPSG